MLESELGHAVKHPTVGTAETAFLPCPDTTITRIPQKKARSFPKKADMIQEIRVARKSSRDQSIPPSVGPFNCLFCPSRTLATVCVRAEGKEETGAEGMASSAPAK